MKKALIIYSSFFVIVSLFAGMFYGINYSSNKESNVSYDTDEAYPEEMRPPITTADNEEPENELYFEEEDPVSLEDFVDFEIEEEPKKSEKEQEKKTKIEEEEILEDEEEEIPADEEISGDKVEIIPDRVNAREEPNSDAKIVAVFDRGDDAVLIEQGKSWSIIRVGNNQGYVSNKLWKKM